MRKKAKPKIEETHIEGEVVPDAEDTSTQEADKANSDRKKTRLTLTAYAPLQISPAANYLRYGAQGVPHFGPNAPTDNPPHSHTIDIRLILKQVTDRVLLAFDHLKLHTPDPLSPFDLNGTNIWIGERAEAHLSVAWVWDFYRLYSGIRLTVELPGEDAKPHKAWAEASEALRNLQAGDQVIIESNSRAGNILQIYPVDSSVFEATQDQAK